MDYDIVREKIEHLIKKHNLNRNRFCQLTGLHQSNTNKFLNGEKYSISLTDLYSIAEYFKLSLDYFTDKSFSIMRDNGEPYSAASDNVCFYDVSASAGYGEDIYTEQTTLFPVSKDVLSRIGYAAKDLLVLKVQGDSMEPTLKDGDYIFMLSPELRTPFVPRIYVIRDAVKGVKVKRLDTDKYGNLIVQSDNPLYEKIVYSKDEVESGLITIIGAVVGKISTI